MAKIYVQDNERAVLFRKGEAPRVLQPGAHRYSKKAGRLEVIDLRPTLLRAAGQETLTLDGVGIKCGATVTYKVIDPIAWCTATSEDSGAHEFLYLDSQLAMRDIIGKVSATDLLASRSQISKDFQELLTPNQATYGIELVSAQIRDIAFPGELRSQFAQVALAKQESAAALERARGEQATLRSLANAARQLESNPNLRQLRALLALERGNGQLIIKADD